MLQERARATEGSASEAQGVAPASGVSIDPGVALEGSQASGDPASTSPKPGEIDPKQFYQLDPNDPESRVLGSQLRELKIRAGYYDQVQGEKHKAENALAEAQGRIESLQGEIDARSQRDVVNKRLQEMGIGEQPQQRQQEPADPTPWLSDPDAVQPAPSKPVDRESMTRLFREIVREELQPVLGNLRDTVAEVSDEQFQQRDQERQTRQQVEATLKATQAMRAQKWRESYGMDEVGIQQMFEMEEGAKLLERKAEDNLGSGVPENVRLGREQLIEAATLYESVAERRANARGLHDLETARREAEQQLEGQSLSSLPRPDDATPDMTYKQDEVHARNVKAVDDAKGLIAEQRRLEQAAGPRR